jgi:phosphohistidine phosphatase
VVKKLVKRGLAPEVVATSPLVRCRQTAEIVCDRVRPAPELVELETLAPGSDLDALVEWTNSQPADVLAWVGHAPDVDRLASALLGAPSGTLRFRKGAVAALEFPEAEVAPAGGELQYFVAPALLGCRRKSDD